MALGPIRPRFRVSVPGPVDEHVARVASSITEPGSRFVARVLGNHVDITVIHEDRHRWSPCVHLEFLADGDETIVNGLIGPHPNVWTLFAFANITIILTALFGLMLGLAQASIEQSAWGLWTIPIAAALLGVMYFVSQAGQRLAAEQTRALTARVEAALGVPIS